MITIEDLTTEQQCSIAEFIFAYLGDTIIKSEAIDLIEVFQEHHVPEAFVANLSIEDTIDLLMDNTSIEMRDEIMKKYYSGKL